MSSRLLSIVFGALPAQGTGFDTESPEAPPTPSVLRQVLGALRSDEDLARQLQEGDPDALALLFKRHSPLLFRIARRILRNDAEAEDAVQQIFLDVFRSIHQFSPERGQFKPWLLMFVYHRTLNQRRSLLASRFFDTDPLTDLLPELLGRAQQNVQQPENRLFVEQALSGLQPRQRRTVELTYYEGLTAEEIARRTGETVRVVRHNLYRGLERLRKNMNTPRRRMPDAQP